MCHRWKSESVAPSNIKVVQGSGHTSRVRSGRVAVQAGLGRTRVTRTDLRELKKSSPELT